ncbi:MAG TPA: M23 family metallopeptidase [Gemmatimonadota bacterium]|nr:M23 family metallopeptidase [Gemmatimonadota bacterium]
MSWEPAHVRAGDVVLMRVREVPARATVEATLDGHPVWLFPTADGLAGVVGIDMDASAGARPWRLTLREGSAVTSLDGDLPIVPRTYTVQHLTVARAMAELDPATERRALEETERLRLTYRAVSGERLWRGRWVRPVAGEAPGTGFGARRVINGQPRSPHSGIDFAAPVGTPVVAANRGRVALVGEFFFPGRLVILDHGLGLYTLYFHLDTIAVSTGQLVGAGEVLGTVGMTGRVTGPHLHFGAQVGTARIDPAVLLDFSPADSLSD